MSERRFTIHDRRDHVVSGIPGAQAAAPATSDTSFNVELPFDSLKRVIRDESRDDQARTFAFEESRMPFHGFVDYPLLNRYGTLRKRPPLTLVINRRIQEGMKEIESISSRVDTPLRPLGPGRADVEGLPDRRIGHRR